MMTPTTTTQLQNHTEKAEDAGDTFSDYFAYHIIIDPAGTLFSPEMFLDYSEFMNKHAAGWRTDHTACRDAYVLGKELKKNLKFKDLFTNEKITTKKAARFLPGELKRTVSTLYMGVRLITDEELKSMDDEDTSHKNKAETYDDFEKKGQPF